MNIPPHSAGSIPTHNLCRTYKNMGSISCVVIEEALYGNHTRSAKD